MAGYQPRHDTDPVWYNGTQVNALTYTSTQAGVMITAIHGWDERPDIRDVREDRAGDDGEWADNLFLGGRTITIDGEVMGSSWVNLQSRKRSLAAIFNPTSDEVLFKVPDPATASPTTTYAESGMVGYERVFARVIEPISFGETLDPACQTWQVVLRASDPRVYSDEVTTTSSGTSGTAARTVTVDQDGTYPTPVDITVNGPTGSTLSISEPSSGLQVSTSGLTLLSSETLTIEVSDRAASFVSSYERVRLEYDRPNISLIALWMLDESAGTTADNEEGTSAYDGTYTGGYTLNQSGFDTGIASVDLNGSTGYVSIPYSAALNNSGASTMYELWIRPDALGGVPISNRQSGAGGWSLALESDGALTLTMFTSGGATAGTVASSPGIVATSAWHHIVLLVPTGGSPGSGAYIYVNGVSAATGTSTGIVSAPTSQGINIGRSTLASNYFDGRIAAVGVYTGPGLGTSAAAAELYASRYDSSSSSAYQYIDAETARWKPLGTASSTYTLSSSGLNTGSQLSVSYRDARL